MSGRNLLMIVVAVVALSVAGVMVVGQLTKTSTSEEGMEQLVHYACRECNKDFSMTLAEATAQAEGVVNCAHCNSKNTIRGEPCFSCSRVLTMTGHGVLPSKCPHCGSGMTDSPNTGTP